MIPFKSISAYQHQQKAESPIQFGNPAVFTTQTSTSDHP
jgi:hypothetical protein